MILPLIQLDQMRLEKKPGSDDATKTESPPENIKAILDLLELRGQTGSSQTGQSTVLTALHLFISALDGEKSYN